MGIKSYSPYTPSRRHMTGSDFSEITKSTPEKSLVVSLKKNAGRNNQGKITVRHRGGGSRRKYRIIANLYAIPPNFLFNSLFEFIALNPIHNHSNPYIIKTIETK